MATTADLTTTRIHPRKALIIGNNSYTKNPLNNCVNDANDLAAILYDLKFQVTLGINCERQKMSSLISSFGGSIESQDLVLFFFAGHGLQCKEKNYLVPVDADGRIHEEADIENTSINVQSTLDRFSSKTSYITIFILDCCREYLFDNPAKFRGSTNSCLGLHAMTPPGGALLQFACAPGTLTEDGRPGERNGLYTKHLLKHLKAPNKDLDKILSAVGAGVYADSKQKQIPHRVSTIMIDESIYLNSNDYNQTPNSGNAKHILLTSEQRDDHAMIP